MIGSQLEKAVFQACVIVENDFTADLSVATVARQVGVSRYAFQRAFRTLIGESFGQHVRRLRVERAALYLRDTDCEVQELAERSGFWTTTGFIRAFSRQFGTTPQAFRESRTRLAPRSESESADGIGEHHRSLSVCLTHIGEFRLAFLRCTSELSTVIATWERLLDLAARADLLSPQLRFLGLHHDDWDTPEDQTRYDAAIVVPADANVPAPLATRIIPAGLTAQTLTSSGRDDHDISWQRFYQGWLPTSGYTPRLSFVWEEYQADLRNQSAWNQVRRAVQGFPIQLMLPISDEPLEINAPNQPQTEAATDISH